MFVKQSGVLAFWAFRLLDAADDGSGIRLASWAALHGSIIVTGTAAASPNRATSDSLRHALTSQKGKRGKRRQGKSNHGDQVGNKTKQKGGDPVAQSMVSVSSRVGFHGYFKILNARIRRSDGILHISTHGGKDWSTAMIGGIVILKPDALKHGKGVEWLELAALVLLHIFETLVYTKVGEKARIRRSKPPQQVI